MQSLSKKALIRLSIASAACAASLAHAAAPVEACDSESYQTVVHAEPAQYEARAVWLDQGLIKWPGAGEAGVFKLYHSPAASIKASKGGKVSGAAGALALSGLKGSVPASSAERFKYVGHGPVLAVAGKDISGLPALHRQQLVLVQETPDSTVIAATRVQAAGAIDAMYAAAAKVGDLGATVGKGRTGFKLWAPTAQDVSVCTYDSGSARASGIEQMKRDAKTGVWSASKPSDMSGKYYKYAVDVVVDGMGVVRNLVTDPYSVSLTTDSKRSYIANLASAALKPAGWDTHKVPGTVKSQTDMTIYELHVRDFSINDDSVSAANRGKYAAFGETGSNGMKHLIALARAGMTDIHLLPVYDIGSVPEKDCAQPKPVGAADSEAQQALITKTADVDCFNWGYDPYHYSAPEGSFASDPADGAKRIVEFRAMVMNLHRAGLRVGMDVVYNHTFASGQKEKSVLDRIVPGYYHRLNAAGGVEQSTCCDNTATENLMMGKLMVESSELWTREYKIDSFRFDLMGHQPRSVMEQLQARVNKVAGRHVQLIGEGWNFGEVADGARFVQASQLSLDGSGIGTFSDRSRDHVRGGSSGDTGDKMIKLQGYINGLVYDPNAMAEQRPVSDLMISADMVRLGLAGSIRSYRLTTYKGESTELQHIAYGNQPGGYASQPGEAVNYVENHDNQTLYDINVFKLPLATSTEDRARVQMLGAAINAFSQGVAYYHAGIDTLRSKSLDRNSFNAGDWFNRIDWTYQDNYFGTGLPREEDNGKDYPLLKPLLANAALKPAPADITFARDVFRDLLAIRASTTLFRLRTADDIKQRLRFFNTGPTQEPTLIAAQIDGKGYAGAKFKGVSYFINVDKVVHQVTIAEAKGKALRIHPAHKSDKRIAEARYDSASGTFSIPARTAVVFVE